MTRGFSLIELLIALAVCMLLAGAMAGLVLPARAAFDTTPSALDVQQRGRTAIDEVTRALRSANIVLLPSTDDSLFEALYVVAPVLHASQGILDSDQTGAQGPLTLASGSACPAVADVCGFTDGTIAAIADGTGRFDIFTVASASSPLQQLTPASALSAAYLAGATVVEVETHLFRLEDAADGSYSLVRETAGGAVQPIVDHVTGAGITVWGGHPLARYSRSDLEDGPWVPGGPEGTYDASFRDVRRIDFWIRVEPSSALVRGTAAQAALRWVPERTLHASVTLRNVP